MHCCCDATVSRRAEPRNNQNERISWMNSWVRILALVWYASKEYIATKMKLRHTKISLLLAAREFFNDDVPKTLLINHVEGVQDHTTAIQCNYK